MATAINWVWKITHELFVVFDIISLILYWTDAIILLQIFKSRNSDIIFEILVLLFMQTFPECVPLCY